METLSILGQVLFGLFFIFNGFNHLTKNKMMASYAASKGVPIPNIAVFVTGLMLLGGGLSIVSGWYLNYGLWLLVIFFVLVTLIMHNFWADKEPQMRMMNMIHFMKNSALLGAILMLLSMQGAWPWTF